MTTQEGLGLFHEKKNDLFSALVQLRNLALAMDSDEVENRLSGIETSLREESFNVAILGGYKRGKSTFVNALLGEDLLPTGIVPLTSVVTKVRYGTERKARVRFKDGREECIQTAELAHYITERENPGNKFGVISVEVFVNSPQFVSGVNIVDTPGTGSTFVENTRVTHEFLQHADAGVFLLSPEPPIGEMELDFLRLIRDSVDHLMFV